MTILIIKTAHLANDPDEFIVLERGKEITECRESGREWNFKEDSCYNINAKHNQ